MKDGKKPFDTILHALDTHWTYDPDTGIVYNRGKPTGRRKAAYLVATVNTIEKDYINVQCNLPIHCIAWYLAYHEWPHMDIDHIDIDGTNNKLANLRLATRAQNNHNRRKIRKPTTSRYVGVHLTRWGKWQAHIGDNGKQKHLGHFATEEEAARAYDTAARQLFGSFARTNFPDCGISLEPSPPASVLPGAERD